MSNDNSKNEASAEAPKETPKRAPKEAKKDCPSSPTGTHDIFHNEGTDEKYCRYCGDTG